MMRASLKVVIISPLPMRKTTAPEFLLQKKITFNKTGTCQVGSPLRAQKAQFNFTSDITSKFRI